MLALSGCDSSSDDGSGAAGTPLQSRAVDGYLVGANVFCDGQAAGGTGAGGLLSCPAGTELVRVRNGSDVGFDEQASSGGTPFAGELVAPADLGWVTPLSTLAVAMASSESGYDSASFDAATDRLATALGQSGFDLSEPADSVMQLVRLNAQVHQLINAFSDDADDYAAGARALSALLDRRAAAGLAANLTDDVDALMRELNADLEAANSPLALAGAELEQTVLTVQNANIELERATDPVELGEAAKQAGTLGSLITLNRDRDDVRIGLGYQYCYWIYCYDDLYGVQVTSLDNFESDELFDGDYGTAISTNFNELSVESRLLSVNRDIDNVRVTLGIEVESTDAGDRRRLVFVTDEARLSGRQNDARSLRLTVPDYAMVHARTVTTDGLDTELSFELEEGGSFDRIGDAIRLDMSKVRNGMIERGLPDVLRGEGNFRVTMVIGGITANERRNGELRPASAFTVDAGNLRAAGPGIQGYATLLDFDDYDDFD